MPLIHTLSSLLRQYCDPRVLVIGCIAYANGIPAVMTGKTLGVWLETYGLDYVSIGLFGLMHLPYALKFLWAPLLDQLPLPFLKARLGQRRSWLCCVQVLGIISLVMMTFLHPVTHLKFFVLCGLIANFAAASQHVLLLAYQMETLGSQDWGVGEGMGVFTYRLAMLTAGAGSLYLATYLEWTTVYQIMACLMGVGLIAVLLIAEPKRFAAKHAHAFTTLTEWIQYAVWGPFKDFMTQKRWQAILIFMVIYRLPDGLLGMMEPLFFVKLGFSYVEIGNVSKVFGMGATILGSLIGGYWIRIYGYQKTLLWGGIATGLACLLYFIQDLVGPNLSFFYITVGGYHFCRALSLVAFFAYQLTCCNVTFAATQLALLTSLAALTRTVMDPVAGTLVTFLGWKLYFLGASLSALPGILWIRRLPFSRP